MQVLVVSDGHGGARYDRSDVGSRIACGLALREVQQQLAGTPLGGDPVQIWLPWLRETLPERIVALWREAVLAHGRAHPRADGAPPSTLAYGATLGLLVLTPRWWGHTGLGDWDLVRINADGSSELISEEPADPGSGEATCSLCMAAAARHFAPRSALVPIAREQAPFSLLLSSDGIRKSCHSDGDFLTLARYLCALPSEAHGQEPSELAQGLDHISHQGSGDDLSVAIGRWGDGGAPSPAEAAASPIPLVVQPGPTAGDTPGGLPPIPAPAESHRRGPAGGSGPGSATGPRPWIGWLLLAGAGGLVALLALGTASLRGWRSLEPHLGGSAPPQGPLGPAVQTTAAQLCATPRPAPRASVAGPASNPAAARAVSAPDPELEARILGSLNQRKALFGALARAAVPTAPAAPSADAVAQGDPAQRSASPLEARQAAAPPLAAPEQDPLGALIAWSAHEPDLNPRAAARNNPQAPPANQAETASGWLPSWLTLWRSRWLASPPPRQSDPLRLCPELRQALRWHWQQARPSDSRRPGLVAAGAPASRQGPSGASPQPLPGAPSQR